MAAADTQFYDSVLHATAPASSVKSTEPPRYCGSYKDSYSRMVIDEDRESAGLNGFQRSLGFLELSGVPDGLSIFQEATGEHVHGRAGASTDAGRRQKQMHGILDIHLHHAIGIQNICIYQDQDVYAKFSLTHSDAEALRTEVVKAGGRNPIFNQGLQIAVNHHDPVLKCEIWMASENRRYLEDQMLAFVLVPLAALEGKTSHVQDHELVSTDLFHSPNGLVRLTLAFHECTPSRAAYGDALHNVPNSATYNSMTSFSSFPNLNRTIGDNDGSVDAFTLEPFASLSGSVSTRLAMEATVSQGGTLVGSPGRSVFQKVEFPDIRVACENQQMVSDYLTLASTDLTLVCPSESDCYDKQAGVAEDRMVAYTPQSSFPQGPFLQLGSFPVSGADHDMVVNAGEREIKKPHCSSRDESLSSVYNSSGFHAMDDCRMYSNLSGGDANDFPRLHSGSSYGSPSSCTTTEARSPSGAGSSSQGSPSPGSSIFTSTLSRGSSGDNAAIVDSSGLGEQSHNNLGRESVQSRLPLGLLEEREVVRQDIVDLYTKSLQQFTDSLAKVEIPVVASKDGFPGCRHSENLAENSLDMRKRPPTRVFYGSRAFF